MNKICKDYCDLIQAKFFDTIQSIIFMVQIFMMIIVVT